MPQKNFRMFHCLHCGRIWTPRNPDSPKLKCPACGKYSVEEVKENVSECDNNDGSCSGGVSSPGISPPDLPDPGDRKDGESDLLLAGEKDPAFEESRSGSPELEEPIPIVLRGRASEEKITRSLCGSGISRQRRTAVQEEYRLSIYHPGVLNRRRLHVRGSLIGPGISRRSRPGLRSGFVMLMASGISSGGLPDGWGWEKRMVEGLCLQSGV